MSRFFDVSTVVRSHSLRGAAGPDGQSRITCDIWLCTDPRDFVIAGTAVLAVQELSAVCLEFARAGTDVAITYQKKREVAEKLAADIRSLGRKATVHQLTISNASRVNEVVDEAAREHARLHTVVLGAGTLAAQAFLSQMTREQWQTIINEDLNGCFQCHAGDAARPAAVGRWFVDPERAKAALASIFGERVTLEPDESGHSRAWKLHRIQIPFRV